MTDDRRKTNWRFIMLGLLALAATSLGAETPIPYTLPAEGNVSLAVFDPTGRQLRTLLCGVKQAIGPHEVTWDGLDWAGDAVPPGEYEWRLLVSPGLKSEFLLKIGTPFNQFEWPNNHGGPYRLAVCGDVAFIGGSGEVLPGNAVVSLRDGSLVSYAGVNCTVMAGTTGRIAALTGRGLDVYTVVNNYPQRVASRELGSLVARTEVAAQAPALTGDDLQESPPVDLELAPQAKTLTGVAVATPPGSFPVRLHVANGPNPGKVRVYANDENGQLRFLRVENVPEKGGAITLSAVESVGGKVQVQIEPEDAEQSLCRLRAVEVFDSPQRITVAGDHLAVGYPGGGRIAWHSPTGDLKEIGTARVPNLRDLALRADGTVLAISGATVVEVAVGQAPVTRVTGLSNPRFIATDATSGDFFVGGGPGDWQVRRYDREFRPLGVFGRAGGRQQGLYNLEDFLNIIALAADGRGRFLVLENECAPRRLAQFDGQGKLVREWDGGQLFFTLATAEPGNPSRVWMNSHWGWLMEAEVDYAKRTWQPRATYTVNNVADGAFRCSHLGTFGAVVQRGEARYLVPGDGPRLLLVDEEHRQLRPLVVFGLGGSPPINGWLNEANAGRTKETMLTAFFWQDANGDGRPQRDEVTFSRFPQWGYRWTMDADFNYCYFQTTDAGKSIWRLPVLRWDGPRPVYPPLEQAEPLPPIPLPATKKQWSGGLSPGPDGALYEIIKGRGEGFTADYQHTAHTGLWPTGQCGEMALCKWSVTKRRLEWRVGKLSTGGGGFHPGQLDDPVAILGRHEGMILIACRVVMPLQAWTEDGLFVGSMFDRRADDGLPERFYKWWVGYDLNGKIGRGPLQYDMMVGGSVVALPDGDLLYFGAGWNDVPVYRVTGWRDVRRQHGKVTLAAAAPAAVGQGTGLSAEYFGTLKPVATGPTPGPSTEPFGPETLGEDVKLERPDAKAPPPPTAVDLQGTPILRRIDPELWFGNPDTWVKKAWPEPRLCGGHFSARWTGFLEPRYSESYTLKAYVGGPPWDRVRVWLDGQLIIDGWDRGPKGGVQIWSKPIPLHAGQRVPITIEYAKGRNGFLHLCWESPTQEIEHVPSRYLYPLPDAGPR